MRPATYALSLIIVLFATFILPSDAHSAESSRLLKIQKAVDLERSGAGGETTLTKHFVEVSPGVHLAVRGARERRQVRYARWIESLDGDRRGVFMAKGMPAYRHREDFAGRVAEHWTYPDAHRTYVFEGNRLVRTSGF